MSSQHDDLNEETEAGIHQLSEHEMALHQLIQGYMDEHDLSDETTSLMLLEVCFRMHMVGYALETEMPSASGLKLELDRFRREMDNLLRDAKNNADQFITHAKRLRAAAENEPEGELQDERGVAL